VSPRERRRGEAFYAANLNDDDGNDPWTTLATVHRYPVLGAD